MSLVDAVKKVRQKRRKNSLRAAKTFIFWYGEAQKLVKEGLVKSIGVIEGGDGGDISEILCPQPKIKIDELLNAFSYFPELEFDVPVKEHPKGDDFFVIRVSLDAITVLLYVSGDLINSKSFGFSKTILAESYISEFINNPKLILNKAE